MKKLNLPALPKISIPAPLSGARRRQVTQSQEPVKNKPIPLSAFEKYYRNKLLSLLNLKDLEGRSVLLVGCDKAWLLPEIARMKPKEIFGIDSSREVINEARRALGDYPADLFVVNDPTLPYPDAAFDVVLVVQQLQHTGSGKLLRYVMGETCRVARQWLILVEDTDLKYVRTREVTRRKLSYYKTMMLTHRFHLRKTGFLPVGVSRTVLSWLNDPGTMARWLLNPLFFVLGFPWAQKPVLGAVNKVPPVLQRLVLAFTPALDELFLMPKGVTKMMFERERLFRRG